MWTFPTLAAAAPNSYTQVLHPAVVLAMAVVAGVATVLMLPSRREASIGKIGGVIALAVGLIFVALLVKYAAGQGKGGMGVYFWVFSAIAVVSAVRVVTHRKPVYSALYFVLTVMASAGLFILLWAEFMAAALIIIYAGAILITYVFVIMLAQQAQDPTKPMSGLAEYDVVSRDPLIAASIGFALMGVLLFVIFDKADAADLARPTTPAPSAITTDVNPDIVKDATTDAPYDGTTQQLGRFLFKEQLVNLELAGLILTIATVGAIVIARRRIVETATGTELVETPEIDRISRLHVLDDSPQSIPVYGSENPALKAYPEK
jgi:NADH-quinone oxidoreductase subunit J